MCPNEAHVHPVTAVLVPFVGWMTVDEQRDLIVLSTDQTVADRLAVLINRHGLADVPDDASALTTPPSRAAGWPAPCGLRVVAQLAGLPHDPTKEQHHDPR